MQSLKLRLISLGILTNQVEHSPKQRHFIKLAVTGHKQMHQDLIILKHFDEQVYVLYMIL